MRSHPFPSEVLLINGEEVRVLVVGTLPTGKNLFLTHDAQGPHFCKRKGVRPTSKAYRTAQFLGLQEASGATELAAEVIPMLLTKIDARLQNLRIREKSLHRMLRQDPARSDGSAIRLVASHELQEAAELEICRNSLQRRLLSEE